MASRRGVWTAARTAAHYAYYYPYSLIRLSLHPTFDSIDRLVMFSFRGCGGLIAPFQVHLEFVQFLKIIRELHPRRILEIGTASGGTLFALTRVATEDAQIISLDLPEGLYGGGYQRWKIPLYRSFALPGQRLELIRGDSHQPDSLSMIRDRLGGKPLDFLFIDGDHTYEGVKKDFDMYSPLVRSGGMIAFHDIVPNAEDASCGVDRFWHEVSTTRPHTELVASWDQVGAGIGVLNKP